MNLDYYACKRSGSNMLVQKLPLLNFKLFLKICIIRKNVINMFNMLQSSNKIRF